MRKVIFIICLFAAVSFGIAQTVMTVNGKQLTLDWGSRQGVKVGMTAYVRVMEKSGNRQIPVSIARVVIDSVKETQSQGNYFDLSPRYSIAKGMAVWFKDLQAKGETAADASKTAMKGEKDPKKPAASISAPAPVSAPAGGGVQNASVDLELLKAYVMTYEKKNLDKAIEYQEAICRVDSSPASGAKLVELRMKREAQLKVEKEAREKHLSELRNNFEEALRAGRIEEAADLLPKWAAENPPDEDLKKLKQQLADAREQQKVREEARALEDSFRAAMSAHDWEAADGLLEKASNQGLRTVPLKEELDAAKRKRVLFLENSVPRDLAGGNIDTAIAAVKELAWLNPGSDQVKSWQDELTEIARWGESSRIACRSKFGYGSGYLWLRKGWVGFDASPKSASFCIRLKDVRFVVDPISATMRIETMDGSRYEIRASGELEKKNVISRIREAALAAGAPLSVTK